jgi:alkaline phosphatase D
LISVKIEITHHQFIRNMKQTILFFAIISLSTSLQAQLAKRVRKESPTPPTSQVMTSQQPTIESVEVMSGPMVGYSEMFEVALWVQTKASAKVKFGYWEQGKPENKQFTDEAQTLKEKGYAITLIADKVEPSRKYDYEVYVNGRKIDRNYPLSFQTQVLWQYRTDPPNFKFAVGSCTFINEEAYDRPGRGYGGYYDIFASIVSQKPDFMIWGGDNVYYREPDWNTRTGMIHRNTHMKALPELQPLWGSVHHYAIWDDHDYGPNDSDRGFWMKNTALDVFKSFWANPNYIFKDEATTGTFQWGDVQFFLMDDRWFKAPNESDDKNKDYYGKKQLDWLIDALEYSQAPFKIVVTGGQVVNPVSVFENMSTCENERNQLLDRIAKAKIKGVMFVSGDRHHTCLQKLERQGTYPLYDLTVSPLTSGPSKPVASESTSPIVEGTIYGDRNFGLIEVSGKRTDRVMKISIYNTKNELQWTREIKASELK